MAAKQVCAEATVFIASSFNDEGTASKCERTQSSYVRLIVDQRADKGRESRHMLFNDSILPGDPLPAPSPVSSRFFCVKVAWNGL
jgi:hypothetical protein